MSNCNCKGCDEPIAFGGRLCGDCEREGVVVPLDNVEFLTELMENGRTGPVAQMFIFEAIRRYAEACAKATPADFGDMSNWMAPEAWIATAKEIQGKMKERIG